MGVLLSMRHWWGHPSAPEPKAEPAPRADVESVRRAMIEAIAPCDARHRARAEAKLAQAQDVMSLWLLRCELYLYLARDLGQVEATQRINALVPVFRGWVPEVHVHH